MAFAQGILRVVNSLCVVSLLRVVFLVRPGPLGGKRANLSIPPTIDRNAQGRGPESAPKSAF